MRYQLLLALLFLLKLFGCAGVTPIPEAGSPMAKVYRERCAACHSLPHPARIDYKWMAPRLLVLPEGIMPVYSPREREAILGYLRGNLAGQGEKIYRLRCGACHEPYPPEELDYSKWKEKIVVLNRAQMPVFSQEEKEAILTYLQRFARGVE